jgi:hypothetical protein
MPTITLQDPTSQKEPLPQKSTTVTLRDPSSQPWNRPTEVKTLSEARTLPDGVQPIMSETMGEWRNVVSPKDDNVFINTHYYIPYILWGQLFVREIHEVTNNHREIHTVEYTDKKGMGGHVHETFCPDGDKVEHFEANVLNAQTKNDDLTPPVQTELNGKPALIFRRLNYTGKESLYLVYYGDKKAIAKLLQRYESGMQTRKVWVWVKGVVSKLP